MDSRNQCNLPMSLSNLITPYLSDLPLQSYAMCGPCYSNVIQSIQYTKHSLLPCTRLTGALIIIISSSFPQPYGLVMSFPYTRMKSQTLKVSSLKSDSSGKTTDSQNRPSPWPFPSMTRPPETTRAATLDSATDPNQPYDFRGTQPGLRFFILRFFPQAPFVPINFFLNADELPEGLEGFSLSVTPSEERTYPKC